MSPLASERYGGEGDALNSGRELVLVPQPRSLALASEQLKKPFTEPKIRLDDHSLPPEGYRLVIRSTGVEIAAHSATGAFYARQTLQQIQAQCGDTLPCLEVNDAPAFAERGYMLDISRCRVPTMETLFGLIDLLSSFKYNQLQLYTEHAFAYREHTTVWRDSSPLTPEEVRQLDAYCRERFVELVPNQNSLGHFERWLKHPEYQHLAECPDGFVHPVSGVRKNVGSSLCPTDESRRLIEGLYDQLLPCFSSSKFNVGCDEPWELGQGRSKALFPGQSRADLYFGVLKQIAESVRQRGKEMYFWADAALEHRSRLRDIPKHACAVLWGYEADHPFDKQCQALSEAGIPFVVSPGDSSWLSLAGRFSVAEANIPEAAKAAQKHGARGILLTQWGDQGHTQPWPVTLPPLVLGGAQAWNPQVETVPLAQALDRFVFQDSQQVLGQWLIDIGNIDSVLGTARFNRSLLYGQLRQSPFPQDHEDGCGTIDRSHLGQLILRFEERLKGAVPTAPDGPWVMDECSFILDALRVIEKNVECTLSPRFQALWLRRYRLGGLDESARGFL